MATEYRLPRKLKHYLSQILHGAETSPNNSLNSIGKVIRDSRFVLREAVHFDNWNGGIHSHEIVFFVPLKLWQSEGFHDMEVRKAISDLITDQINKANDLISDEDICNTIIAINDPDDKEFCVARGFDDGSLSLLLDFEEEPGISPRPASTNITDDSEGLWKMGLCRLFISHRDSSKRIVKELAEVLKTFGVDSFVAHEDIEPTRAWREEILRALESMDAILAFVTDDFFESPWTNQELGFAVARRAKVISLKLGKIDPQGFISNEQAQKGEGLTVYQQAEKIVDILISSKIGIEGIKQAFIERFEGSASFRGAEENFSNLQKFQQFSEEEIDRLVRAFNENGQNYLASGLGIRNQFLNFINSVSSRDFERITPEEEENYSKIKVKTVEDDLPF